jgi:hypothetical protein
MLTSKHLSDIEAFLAENKYVLNTGSGFPKAKENFIYLRENQTVSDKININEEFKYINS